MVNDFAIGRGSFGHPNRLGRDEDTRNVGKRILGAGLIVAKKELWEDGADARSWGRGQRHCHTFEWLFLDRGFCNTVGLSNSSQRLLKFCNELLLLMLVSRQSIHDESCGEARSQRCIVARTHPRVVHYLPVHDTRLHGYRIRVKACLVIMEGTATAAASLN